MGYDPNNSHYLNEKNRIFPQDPHVAWVERDADFNIRTGLTFGETEEETIMKQNWKDSDR